MIFAKCLPSLQTSEEIEATIWCW